MVAYPSVVVFIWEHKQHMITIYIHVHVLLLWYCSGDYQLEEEYIRPLPEALEDWDMEDTQNERYK